MAFIAPVMMAMGASAATAGTVATVAGVASAALGVASAIQQGNQNAAAEQTAANMATYNAKVADMRAAQTGVETNMREDEQRRRARSVIGEQLAASGEAGAGLNEDLLRQSIYDSEADTSAIRYEGALKRAGYTDEVALQRSNAEQRSRNASEAKSAGYMNAFSSLAKSGANYFGGKALN